MAYTRYGWNIDINSLQATYNSDIDANWKTGGVQIKDRGWFSGHIAFAFKTPVQARFTHGFYLNVWPEQNKQQYTFLQGALYASADWGSAYDDLPPRPFSSYGLGNGRTIDTLKEVWIGNVNLGRRYSVTDLEVPDQRFIAAEYGIYTDDANSRWVCVRDGTSFLYSDGLVAFADYLNDHANWWLNQDISVWEWDHTQDYGDIAHGLRKAIAGRQGVVWVPTQTGMWWDTKSALSDNRTTDFTSENVVAWINDRKLTEDHRIEDYGASDVYVVVVDQASLNMIEIISATPQAA